MFFSWFTKNKHFKKRSNLTGQIMPFLLVIIAIFLGVTFTTINLGTNAIDINCTNNASDACVLAAASAWSQVLNTVMGINETIKADYVNRYAIIKDAIDLRDKALDDAKSNIEATVQSIHAAAVPDVGPEASYAGTECQPWDDALTARGSLMLAHAMVECAADSFHVVAEISQQISDGIDQLKADRQQAYQEIRTGLEDAHTAAQELGAIYAYQNMITCIVTGGPDGPQVFSGQDSFLSTAPVFLPNITSYQLQVTQRGNPCPYCGIVRASLFQVPGCGYPGALDGPDSSIVLPPPGDGFVTPGTECIDPYAVEACLWLEMGTRGLELILECAANEMWNIYQRSVELANECQLGAYQWAILKSRCLAVYRDLEQLIDQLNLLLLNCGPDQASIPTLKEQSQKILEAFSPDNKRVISDSSGAPGDVMIIGIDSLTFEDGCATCDVPTAGGQYSTSSGSYGGGNMTDGTGAYTPGLSGDVSCPPSSPPVGNTPDAACPCSGGGGGVLIGGGGGDGGDGGGNWATDLNDWLAEGWASVANPHFGSGD